MAEVEDEEPPAELSFLVNLTLPLGRWLQLNKCPGFLSNSR